jgi:putative ABC transport system permease protein
VNLLFGALSMGLVLSLLGLGVYISYRILDTFDLTVDGSFAFGAVIAGVLLTRGLASFWASAAGFLAGMAAGAISGVVHRRLGVSRLLSGLLVATALYSLDLLIMGGGDISLASTRTLPTQAFDLWLRFGGPESGARIFGTEVSARTLATFLSMLPAVGTAVFLVDRFFRTSLGLAMRATGDNAQMTRSVGIDDARVFIAGLAVSNGLVGLSGALFAQYQGFVTIQMSVGMLVMGLAAVALAEGLLRGRSLGARIAGVVGGSIVLRLVVALALAAGLPANTLKLVTAALTLAVLVVPDLIRRRRLAPGVS